MGPIIDPGNEAGQEEKEHHQKQPPNGLPRLRNKRSGTKIWFLSID